MTEENPWQIKKSSVKYENAWIKVREDAVITPAGQKGIYGVVHMKNTAVGILPIDDAGYTWIVGQYRYPLNQYEWEIPEGGCPNYETPLECAKRELLEETGIVANDWYLLLNGVQQSNSVSDEISYSFLAKNLTFKKAMPEQTEVLEVKKIHFEELLDLTIAGKIRCSVAVATILLYNTYLKSGQLDKLKKVC